MYLVFVLLEFMPNRNFVLIHWLGLHSVFHHNQTRLQTLGHRAVVVYSTTNLTAIGLPFVRLVSIINEKKTMRELRLGGFDQLVDVELMCLPNVAQFVHAILGTKAGIVSHAFTNQI